MGVQRSQLWMCSSFRKQAKQGFCCALLLMWLRLLLPLPFWGLPVCAFNFSQGLPVWTDCQQQQLAVSQFCIPIREEC